MPKKPAARQKKVVAALSPTAASPEVLIPVVALEDAVTAQPQAPEKKNKARDKDKDRIKPKKQKLVRDSFTMPEQEYETLAEMKKNCIKAGVSVKKSELLRVAVSLLRKMDVPQVQQALTGLTPVKAGRPSKQK
jgi:hypothetical protein